MTLIPRSVFFGNTARSFATLSPDGKYFAFIAPNNGVNNIWVAPSHDINQQKCVSDDNKRGIRSYSWTYESSTLVYEQDRGGDENFALYKVSVDNLATKRLCGGDQTRAEIVKLHKNMPGHLLIAMNERDPKQMDYYSISLATGERNEIYQNKEGFSQVIFDSAFRPRVANLENPDASLGIYYFSGESNQFEFNCQVPFEDAMTTSCWNFIADEQMIWVDSRCRDTAALKMIDFVTREETLVAEHPTADTEGVYYHPQTERVQAVTFNPSQRHWVSVDPSFAIQLEYLNSRGLGELDITSRTLEDDKWLVSYRSDINSPRYFLYEPKIRALKFLFEIQPELSKYEFSSMETYSIPARDRFELVSYLTSPKIPAAGMNVPNSTVLLVHGGPWARDTWGYNPRAQWLSNRGYTVLSVNFRGSVGFGKTFVNAGNKEWAGKMHDDLVDACRWAVDRKISDPGKIAIMGGSYGGYAALVGLTFTPDFFACAVDIVGPSNINTLLETVPAYWESMRSMFKKRVGDHETLEGRQFLADRSPLNFVGRIQKPLLILQGANDPRVKQAEADQIYEAMKQYNIPVEYVVFPDEGHGFAEPHNNIASTALIEVFLAKYLGGRFEPLGNDVTSSSAQIRD